MKRECGAPLLYSESRRTMSSGIIARFPLWRPNRLARPATSAGLFILGASYTYLRMDLVQALVILFGLVNLALGAFLYFNSNKSRVVRLYALIIVFATLWSFSTLMTGVRLPFPYFAAAMTGHYIFGYLAYLSFFWFALMFPERPKWSLLPVGILSVLSVAVLFLIPFTRLFFDELKSGADLASSVVFNETGYIGFILMLSGVFFAGLVILLRTMHQADRHALYRELDPTQVYFAILANLVAGVFGIVLNLVFPLYGNFSLFYINPVLVTGALVVIGLYNILRYNLFNSRIIVSEFFAAGLVILSLTRVVLSQSQTEFIVNSVIFIFVLAFGILLIQGVFRETKLREELEREQKALEKANQKLKEIDREKTEFVSIASHQLRSPLTAIKGYASMLLEGSYGPVLGEMKQVVERIFNSSELMAASVQDFLDVSRIEQGRMKYEMKEMELGKVVRTAVEELQSVAHKKGVVLTYKSRGEPFTVSGDLGKLKQVFSNLVDNSLKYTPKGSINVDVSHGANIIRMVIKDTGCGMSKETMGKIFDKFVRADNANKVNVMGTGLGL